MFGAEYYIEEALLDAYLDHKENVMVAKKSNPFWGFDLSPRYCFKLYYVFLNPNEYGTWLQKYIIHNHSCLYSISNTKFGDAINNKGAHFEIKASYSDKNNNYSFWQCRPWEPLMGHYFMCINRPAGFVPYIYFMTKDAFLEELTLLRKIDFTHGKKTRSFLEEDFDLFNSMETKIKEAYKNKRSLTYIKELGEQRLNILIKRHVEITLRLKSDDLNSGALCRWNMNYLFKDMVLLEKILADIKG